MPEKLDRAELKQRLADFDARVAGIEAEAAPIRALLRPIQERIDAVEDERQELLDANDAEVIGECSTCGALLLRGDLGNEARDDSDMIWCAEHSPTLADLLAMWNEQPDDEEDKPAALDYINGRLASGEPPDTKVTWAL